MLRAVKLGSARAAYPTASDRLTLGFAEPGMGVYN